MQCRVLLRGSPVHPIRSNILLKYTTRYQWHSGLMSIGQSDSPLRLFGTRDTGKVLRCVRQFVAFPSKRPGCPPKSVGSGEDLSGRSHVRRPVEISVRKPLHVLRVEWLSFLGRWLPQESPETHPRQTKRDSHYPQLPTSHPKHRLALQDYLSLPFELGIAA